MPYCTCVVFYCKVWVLYRHNQNHFYIRIVSVLQHTSCFINLLFGFSPRHAVKIPFGIDRQAPNKTMLNLGLSNLVQFLRGSSMKEHVIIIRLMKYSKKGVEKVWWASIMFWYSIKCSFYVAGIVCVKTWRGCNLLNPAVQVEVVRIMKYLFDSSCVQRLYLFIVDMTVNSLAIILWLTLIKL